MAFTPFNGTKLGVYSGGTLIAGATNHSLSISAASIDVTTKDSLGWKEIISGLREWSISADAVVAYDATLGVEALFDALANRSKLTLKFSTEISGDERWSGSAYVTSIEKTAGLEEAVTFSVTFEGTGAITRSTVT